MALASYNPTPPFRIGTGYDCHRLVEGRKLIVGASDPHGRSTLIAFVSPDCPVCASLLPTIKRIATEEQSRLKVIFASDGDAAAHRRYVADKDLGAFPYVLSRDLGQSFGIGRLPYAVLIDASRCR